MFRVAVAYILIFSIGYLRGKPVTYKEWSAWVLGALIASFIYVIVTGKP